MNARIVAFLGAISLIAAACGRGETPQALAVPEVTITSLTTTTTSAPATTTTAATPVTGVAAATAGVPPTEAFGTVGVSGDPLPPAPSQGPDPAAGTPVPGLSGHDFDGNPVSIAHDGRAKMIVFLAHWCPHCQRELPLVTNWLGTDPLPDGVDVYAVATLTRPERDNYPPSAWFETEGWPGPVIVDDRLDSAASAFGLMAVPYWVIVGADGTLVVRGSGGVPAEVLTEIALSIAP